MFRDRLHYFIKNPPRDDRSRFAHMVDLLLSWLFIWFLTVLALQLLPLGQSTINYLSVLFLIIEAVAVAKYKRIKQQALGRHRDIWYSARRCREAMKKVDTGAKFALLVKELLESNAAFNHLEPYEDGKTVHLLGHLKGNQIGVMCLNSSSDEMKVNRDALTAFLHELTALKINRGIAVTSGSFTDDARRFVRRINGKVKIHLIDGYGLLHMAKRTRHPIFPEEKWRDDQNTLISGLEMALSIKENILASRRRALLFVSLGIAFLVISALQTGPLGLIYLIFGVINIFIGFTGLILSYARKNEIIFD